MNQSYKNPEKFTLTPECQNDKPLSDYLNDPEVQKAIHVKFKKNGTIWEICNETVFQSYHKDVVNTEDQFNSFFKVSNFYFLDNFPGLEIPYKMCQIVQLKKNLILM